MPKRRQPPARGLRWLVEGRNEIQGFLLDLYEFGPHNRRLGVHKEAVFQLLLGSAFSLWRAVFLANEKRGKVDVRRESRSFLHALISTNTISFNTELVRQDWTVGYYLNDALFRLALAFEKTGGFTPTGRRIHDFVRRQGRPGVGALAEPTRPWELGMAGLNEVFERIGGRVIQAKQDQAP